MLFTSKKGHEVTNKQSAISMMNSNLCGYKLGDKLMQLIIVLRFVLIAALRRFLTCSSYDLLIRYYT